MGKTYVGSSGKKYAVIPWPIASIRHGRILQKWRVCCQAVGTSAWIRYPKTSYYDVPGDAEKELETLARRRGWTLCES